MSEVKKSWLGNLWEKVKLARTIIAAALAVTPFLQKLVSLIGDAEVNENGEDKKKKVLVAFGKTLDGLPWKVGTMTKDIALRIAGTLIEIIVWLKNRRGHDWQT